MKISVVATLYNSAAHIDEFMERMRAELTRATDDFEIVLVDDELPGPVPPCGGGMAQARATAPHYRALPKLRAPQGDDDGA